MPVIGVVITDFFRTIPVDFEVTAPASTVLDVRSQLLGIVSKRQTDVWPIGLGLLLVGMMSKISTNKLSARVHAMLREQVTGVVAEAGVDVRQASRFGGVSAPLEQARVARADELLDRG